MTSSTPPTISGSSAEVGSSNSMTIGSIDSARAIATLLLAAGELAGELVLVCHQADALEHFRPRVLASVGERPSTWICASVRFSVTDRCGNNSKCWNTMPTRERSFGRLVFGSGDRDAVDDDVALLERLERVDGLDQRRLARSRRPADDDDLALADLVVQSVSTWKLPYHLETFRMSIMVVRDGCAPASG